MGVDIKINKAHIKGRITGATSEMMEPLSEQILDDCNHFCREDKGTLIQSSQIASIPKQGVLVWNTIYAKRVFYTGTPSTDANPNASLRWAEKARAQYRASWEKLAQKLFKRGMKN